MGQSISISVDCFQKKNSNLLISTCPYCNIHYGKHLTNHMNECPEKHKFTHHLRSKK